MARRAEFQYDPAVSVAKSAGLADVLDRSVLRRKAGAQSFARGSAYFADGEFCKHCVALGLAWLEREEPETPTPRKPKRATVGIRDVRAYLVAQSAETLADLLLDAAKSDSNLRQRLILQTAKKTTKGIDLDPYYQALEAAIGPGDFVDYESAHADAYDIDEALDSVEGLVKQGYATEAIELSEHALQLIEGACQYVDGSDGMLGSTLERVQAMHHRACVRAKPDPEALADRLFRWELRTDWDTFYNAVETYADVLGENGLAVYRRLAEAEWARLPALGPGAEDSASHGKRFRITHIMEALARRSGDVDALIAIRSRDLSSAFAYLQVAETCREAGRHDTALEWAERGLTAFPKRTDVRLREFLAAEYHRRKRHDDAVSLAWTAFAEQPELEEFQGLKRHAAKAGKWKVWRERAIAHVKERITAEKRPRTPSYQHNDNAELVRMLLWERAVEAAWNEARAGGCSAELWLELARKREKVHPEDSLPIYQAQVEPLLARKNNGAYTDAVKMLCTIQDIMSRLGRNADFTSYLRSVRAAHKPKRNLMTLLDRTHWKA